MKKIGSIVAAAALGIVLGVACGGSSKASDESTMPENTGGTMDNPCAEGMGTGDNPCADLMGGDTYGGAAYGGDAYGGGW
jgi:hypothetical protein